MVRATVLVMVDVRVKTAVDLITVTDSMKDVTVIGGGIEVLTVVTVTD